MHFVTMAHQLAWMEHPAIWLCASCAILWLVLRVVRSPLVRAGVLLMLCGLGMNALVTDTNAGSMPVVGMPSTVVPASPMWQSATFQTRMPLLADQARLGLFSIGDIALLGGGILIVAICLRRTLERTRQEVRKKTGLLRPFPPLGVLVTRLVAYETDGCCKQATSPVIES